MARTLIKCGANGCEGYLRKVIETRQSDNQRTNASALFRLVGAQMPSDAWVFRVRECSDSDCRARTPTIEVQFFSDDHKPVVTVPTDGVLKSRTTIRTPPPKALGVLSNFTGEVCTQCGSLNTKRTGTCIMCLDCSHSGGCS